MCTQMNNISGKKEKAVKRMIYLIIIILHSDRIWDYDYSNGKELFKIGRGCVWMQQAIAINILVTEMAHRL